MTDDMATKVLKIDDVWSVEYNPAQNDCPIFWYRHGKKHSPFDENNPVNAMFYALLEKPVSLELPDDLVKTLREIGPAQWGMVGPHDAETHSAHVRKSIEATAEHFGQTGPQEMHGVYIKDTGIVISHTGTSPNSPNIARALTIAWNALRRMVQDE